MGHGNEYNAELDEKQRVAEMEAELAALRARDAAPEKVAPELSTRDRSPITPQDHKPAAAEAVQVEFEGITFTATRGKLGSLRVLDLLERNQIATALRTLVGDEKFEEFLTRFPDADAEMAGKMLEAIAKAVGAGN
ncbi:hypothetical protein MUN78_10185 [Leucobacter allii]|uniref:Uncharacterized protein n=1 Tax=Leucobacter allii TaxID=2932247 RepID=A0ABY4FJG9_9MICO|nr:hypothetical protein [Leucobacter allii]UOQ56072.1 hypothetical protein MUN78_10185 [Leucobacter allii]